MPPEKIILRDAPKEAVLDSKNKIAENQLYTDLCANFGAQKTLIDVDQGNLKTTKATIITEKQTVSTTQDAYNNEVAKMPPNTIDIATAKTNLDNAKNALAKSESYKQTLEKRINEGYNTIYKNAFVTGPNKNKIGTDKDIWFHDTVSNTYKWMGDLRAYKAFIELYTKIDGEIRAVDVVIDEGVLNLKTEVEKGEKSRIDFNFKFTPKEVQILLVRKPSASNGSTEKAETVIIPIGTDKKSTMNNDMTEAEIDLGRKEFARQLATFKFPDALREELMATYETAIYQARRIKNENMPKGLGLFRKKQTPPVILNAQGQPVPQPANARDYIQERNLSIMVANDGEHYTAQDRDNNIKTQPYIPLTSKIETPVKKEKEKTVGDIEAQQTNDAIKKLDAKYDKKGLSLDARTHIVNTIKNSSSLSTADLVLLGSLGKLHRDYTIDYYKILALGDESIEKELERFMKKQGKDEDNDIGTTSQMERTTREAKKDARKQERQSEIITQQLRYTLQAEIARERKGRYLDIITRIKTGVGAGEVSSVRGDSDTYSILNNPKSRSYGLMKESGLTPQEILALLRSPSGVSNEYKELYNTNAVNYVYPPAVEHHHDKSNESHTYGVEYNKNGAADANEKQMSNSSLLLHLKSHLGAQSPAYLKEYKEETGTFGNVPVWRESMKRLLKGNEDFNLTSMLDESAELDRVFVDSKTNKPLRGKEKAERVNEMLTAKLDVLMDDSTIMYIRNHYQRYHQSHPWEFESEDMQYMIFSMGFLEALQKVHGFSEKEAMNAKNQLSNLCGGKRGSGAEVQLGVGEGKGKYMDGNIEVGHTLKRIVTDRLKRPADTLTSPMSLADVDTWNILKYGAAQTADNLGMALAQNCGIPPEYGPKFAGAIKLIGGLGIGIAGWNTLRYIWGGKDGKAGLISTGIRAAGAGALMFGAIPALTGMDASKLGSLFMNGGLQDQKWQGLMSKIFGGGMEQYMSEEALADRHTCTNWFGELSLKDVSAMITIDGSNRFKLTDDGMMQYAKHYPIGHPRYMDVLSYHNKGPGAVDHVIDSGFHNLGLSPQTFRTLMEMYPDQRFDTFSNASAEMLEALTKIGKILSPLSQKKLDELRTYLLTNTTGGTAEKQKFKERLVNIEKMTLERKQRHHLLNGLIRRKDIYMTEMGWDATVAEKFDTYLNKATGAMTINDIGADYLMTTQTGNAGMDANATKLSYYKALDTLMGFDDTRITALAPALSPFDPAGLNDPKQYSFASLAVSGDDVSKYMFGKLQGNPEWPKDNFSKHYNEGWKIGSYEPTGFVNEINLTGFIDKEIDTSNLFLGLTPVEGKVSDGNLPLYKMTMRVKNKNAPIGDPWIKYDFTQMHDTEIYVTGINAEAGSDTKKEMIMTMCNGNQGNKMTDVTFDMKMLGDMAKGLENHDGKDTKEFSVKSSTDNLLSNPALMDSIDTLPTKIDRTKPYEYYKSGKVDWFTYDPGEDHWYDIQWLEELAKVLGEGANAIGTIGAKGVGLAINAVIAAGNAGSYVINSAENFAERVKAMLHNSEFLHQANVQSVVPKRYELFDKAEDATFGGWLKFQKSPDKDQNK